MYGAILGDIIGEPYEAGGNPKTKDFPLFCAEPRFTDDESGFDGKYAALGAKLSERGLRREILSLAAQCRPETVRQFRKRIGDAGVFGRLAF